MPSWVIVVVPTSGGPFSASSFAWMRAAPPLLVQLGQFAVGPLDRAMQPVVAIDHGGLKTFPLALGRWRWTVGGDKLRPAIAR